MQSVLPAPSIIFGDEFFTSSIYPVRVLFDIAGLYQARAIEVERLKSLRLSTEEEKDKMIGPIIWLCSVLDMPTKETRELVAEYKKSRTLTGILPTRMIPPTPFVAPAYPQLRWRLSATATRRHLRRL